jgi:hypothetical protein
LMQAAANIMVTRTSRDKVGDAIECELPGLRPALPLILEGALPMKPT